MSMFWVGAIIAVGTTYMSAKAQDDQAKFQVEQGNLDMIASNSATEQAEKDARDEEAFELSDLAREFLATKSTAVAQQANSGIAGVTSDRQRRNIDFQHSLDVGTIKRKGENTLTSIRNSGFQNNSQIQSSINVGTSNKVSGGEMATRVGLSALSAYANKKSTSKTSTKKVT